MVQRRQPRGVPTGGQFAAGRKVEAGGTDALAADPDGPSYRTSAPADMPPLSRDWVTDFSGGSAEDHLVEGPPGQWRFTAERKALHNQIIASILDGLPPQDNPQYVIMGGGPAAGKSTLEQQAPELSRQAGIINADDIKEQLPEYDQMLADGDPDAARFCHEESSYIAKAALREGMDRQVNLMLDGTGNGRPSDLYTKITQARSAGYRVEGHYVTIPTEEAVRRSTLRAQRTGRMVPERVVRLTHRNVSIALEQVMDTFDTVKVYDNTDQFRLIAEAHGDEPTIHDQQAWDGFLAKKNDPTNGVG